MYFLTSSALIIQSKYFLKPLLERIISDLSASSLLSNVEGGDEEEGGDGENGENGNEQGGDGDEDEEGGSQ